MIQFATPKAWRAGNEADSKVTKQPVSRSVISRKHVLPATLGTGLLALTLLIFGAMELVRQQRGASLLIEHTLEVLAKSATLEADLATVSSEGRGFLVDRTADSVVRFEAASRQAMSDVSALQILTSDNPSQGAALNRLAPLIAARINFLRTVIEHLQGGDEGGAQRLVQTQQGRLLMDQILSAIEDIKSGERRLLATRIDARLSAEQLLIAGLILCGVLAAASVLLAVALQQARYRERVHVTELENLVRQRTAALMANEAKLQESESHFRLLAEQANDLVVRVAADGRRIYASPASTKIIGWKPEELLARSPREICHPDDLPAFVTMQERLLSGEAETYTLTHRLLNPLRGEVWVEAGARVLRDAVTHAPNGYISVVRDVTERKKTDEALRQAQRMDAIGQVTAGVAHDFNNLLHAILGSIEMLHEQTGLDAEGFECVEIAEQAARRGALLTHRLLAFSRKQALDPVLLEPSEVLKDVEALLARTIGGRMRVELHIDGDIWPVCADGAQLDNCLLNLALNARDATPGGGVIRLHLSNQTWKVAEALGLPKGEYICFAVEDEGVGMTPETLARALEPFFTTKPVGQGTGLGLSMVQGFARQSGGDVRIESVPGQGTKVSLWLPRAHQSQAKVGAPSAVESEPEYGRGRIMVVDDEETVLRTVSLFLKKAGFDVIAIDNSQKVLELLRSGESCDLLLTDQSMPGLTGCELIEEVLQLRSGLPVILITGYDAVCEIEQLPGHVTIIQKPFERAVLLSHIKALLGSFRSVSV